MPAIHNKPCLLTPQKIAVRAEGDNVMIDVGNSTLTMHYEAALQISQWIRLRAKEAKRRAGDMSRHWSAIAQLENIEQ